LIFSLHAFHLKVYPLAYAPLLCWTRDKTQTPVEQMDRLFNGLEIPEIFKRLEKISEFWNKLIERFFLQQSLIFCSGKNSKTGKKFDS